MVDTYLMVSQAVQLQPKQIVVFTFYVNQLRDHTLIMFGPISMINIQESKGSLFSMLLLKAKEEIRVPGVNQSPTQSHR